MFKKVSILCLFFVACMAEDTSKSAIHYPSQQGYVVEQSYDGYLVPTAADEDYSLNLPVASGAVGLKSTAIAIASKLFFWVLGHFWAIIVGAAATFAFCKITQVCDLKYKKYPEVEHLRSLITPSRLASASDFLAKAVEKFTSEQAKSAHIKAN